jgi:hypothetical protein
MVDKTILELTKLALMEIRPELVKWMTPADSRPDFPAFPRFVVFNPELEAIVSKASLLAHIYKGCDVHNLKDDVGICCHTCKQPDGTIRESCDRDGKDR